MKAPLFIQGSDEKNFIIRAGICQAIVCTNLKDKKAITKKINRDAPAGTTNGWILTYDKPIPCKDIAGNFHYFFEC